jgi:hypothetical protein
VLGSVPWLRLALRLVPVGSARHVLTVLALATGVALLCAFDVANRGVLAAFKEVLDTTGGRAARLIRPGGP